MIPTATEERAITLRRQLKLGGDTLKTRWISFGLIVSFVFFFLSTQAISAALGFAAVLGVRSGVLIGLCALVLAELLILRFRLFGTGVEAALWLTAIGGIVFDVARSWKEEALLALAVAALIASFRLRNAWFTAIATGALFVYAGFRLHGWNGDWTEIAIAGVIVCFWATALLARQWERSSTEWMFIAVSVSAFIAGAVCTFVSEATLWPMWLLLAAVTLVFGIRIRHHLPLLVSILAVVVAAVRVHKSIPWSAEMKLIVAGGVLVAIAAAISRMLRDRTSGLVLEETSLTPSDEALQMAATVALQPQVSPAPEPARAAGEGGFGGAGASGEY